MLVGIPTLGLSPHLSKLAGELKGHHDVRLWCNGTWEDWLRVARMRTFCPAYWCPDRGIYHVWNSILDQGGERPVAVFNDDIHLDCDSVDYAGDLMDSDPSIGIIGWDPDPAFGKPQYNIPVVGSYREGGITGFAFVVRPVPGIRFDESFHWWGGDDDIVYQYRQAGYHAIKMVGRAVLHWASTTSNARPEVLSGIGEDRQRLLDKWGRTW